MYPVEHGFQSKFSSIVMVVVTLLLHGCGGGGGSPGSSTASGFSQTYSASAAAGELLSYSIDTSNLTYSYTVTKSSYGCEIVSAPCHSGSGTLVRNADGTFSPSQSPSTKIYALQNGLLIGAVTLPINNVNRIVPFIGVPNPVTSVISLAGVYNYMTMQCQGLSYGIFTGCGTGQGTVQVSSNGTYTTCINGDLNQQNPVCSGGSSGTMTSLGGGIWQFQSSNPLGMATNYMLVFSAPNGQKVGVIDFNDALVYGYGQAVVSSSVATTFSDIAGNYVALSVYGDAGTVRLNANGTTSSGASMTLNAPWQGMATVSSNYGTGYGILAGNGVYVYRNTNIPNRPAYYEVGMRLN